MYIVLYAPTSVQRLLDFQKTVYCFNKHVPVIIKPVGAAAQIGVPEAHKLAYKMNKPLIILPEINDLFNVLNVSKVYYLSRNGRETSIEDIGIDDKTAIVIVGGEQEPGKKELEGVDIIRIKEIPGELPPIALISILLFMLK